MSRSSKLDALAFYFPPVLALFSLENIPCQLISIKSVASLAFASALLLCVVHYRDWLCQKLKFRFYFIQLCLYSFCYSICTKILILFVVLVLITLTYLYSL